MSTAFGDSTEYLEGAAYARIADGAEAKLYGARDSGSYTGELVAMDERYALQRLRETNSFVVHDMDKLEEPGVRVGENYTIRYKDGRPSVEDPAQTADGKPARAADGTTDQTQTAAARDQSYFQMRGSLMKQFGRDIKVYEAKTDIGRYTGTIVSISPDRVAQQVSRSGFVVHERDRLAGQYQRGTLVDVNYNNGRAIATLTPQQREQSAQQPNRQFTPDATKQPATPTAPRADAVDEATLHTNAAEALGRNADHLKSLPGLKRAPADQIAQLAYFRGVIQEKFKADLVMQAEKLTKFDDMAQQKDKIGGLLKGLDPEPPAQTPEQSADREHMDDTPSF